MDGPLDIMPAPPPPPIGIKQALDDVSDYATQILRRNQVLIDYYIYPHNVPTDITAYEPRLRALEKRIKHLKSLHFAHLRQLIDDPDTLAATQLWQISDQLQSAICGFRNIFEKYYDQKLGLRNPYANMLGLLGDISRGLVSLKEEHQRDYGRYRAENQPATGSTTFCKGGIQLINGFDAGGLNQVDNRELLEANKTVIRRLGGCFLWWACKSCNFRIRYHVSASKFASIQSNNEVVDHDSIPIDYRPSFMAKSHLYLPDFDNLPRRAARYGCVFCFVQGKALEIGRTTFATCDELASHICGSHRSSLPAPLILMKFNVAVNNRLPDGCKRFDINLRF